MIGNNNEEENTILRTKRLYSIAICDYFSSSQSNKTILFYCFFALKLVIWLSMIFFLYVTNMQA